MNVWLISILFIALSVLTSIEGKAQEQEKIKWYTVEEAFEAGKIERRKFFIDVYTTWCGPCRILGPRLDAAVANTQSKVNLVMKCLDNSSMHRSYR